jgi:divalent metal cation (Fe/Co/Zn/Cd) transporter
MHLHVDGNMNVAQAHELASRIEHRIEQALGPCNATAHVEPADPASKTDSTEDRL